jgi:hypothetical protein
MSDTRDDILNFIATARRDPMLATSAARLDALESSVLNDASEGFTALTAPTTDRTWEIRAQLPGNSTDTGRIKFEFPWAVDIAGMNPVVTPVRPIPAGVAIPTTDDIDVLLDIDKVFQLTSADGISTVGGQGGNTFVTLTHISIFLPRIQRLTLHWDVPKVGFTFRWKQPPVLPTIFFADAIVCVGMFAYKYDGPSSAMGGAPGHS